jgi:RNA polymerase sigma-70 factor (ECF subfamily)
MATSPDDDAGSATPPAAADSTSLTLLERARAKEEEAWRRIVLLYRPLVLAWCAHGGVTAEDAEDVAQEVFAGAAQNLEHFHHDRPGDTFRGWLRGITRNRLLMHYRHDQGKPQAEGGSVACQRIQEVPDPDPGPVDDEAEISLLYRRALDQVRGEFEARTWQAFWGTVVEGRSPAVLAPELGLSPAGVRQAKSRVLRRLKGELGDLIQ